jgi:4-oxalocrotonate tautomerase
VSIIDFYVFVFAVKLLLPSWKEKLMPMITIRYVTPRPRPELRAEIAALATRLAAECLRKDPSVTAILVEEADPAGWFIAGSRPADAGLSAFWLDIKITAATNVKSETTAFVAAAFKGFGELLGPLHEESYVLVHAVDGDAYGYGGRTQNGRFAVAHPG